MNAHSRDAGGREDLWPGLLKLALPQQPGGRTVVELGVEPLEPRLRDLSAVALLEHDRDLQRDAKPLLDEVARLALGFGPLAHSPRLSHTTDIGGQMCA